MPHLQPAPEPHSGTKTWLKANGAPFQTLQQNGGFELCQHNTRGLGFLYELLLVFTKINLNDFCCKLSSSKPDKNSVEGFVFYLNIGQAGSPKIWFLILTLLGSNTETLIQWVSISYVPCTCVSPVVKWSYSHLSLLPPTAAAKANRSGRIIDSIERRLRN